MTRLNDKLSKTRRKTTQLNDKLSKTHRKMTQLNDKPLFRAWGSNGFGNPLGTRACRFNALFQHLSIFDPMVRGFGPFVGPGRHIARCFFDFLGTASAKPFFLRQFLGNPPIRCDVFSTFWGQLERNHNF